MRDNIYCLYTNGGPLTDNACSFLYVKACQMIVENETSLCLKYPNAEINLRTKFQFGCIGHLAGTRFEVVIEEGERTIRSGFIVRDTDFRNNIKPNTTWVHGSLSDLRQQQGSMN